jgi:hypothetical protein
MNTPHENKLSELRSRAAEIDVEVANLDAEFTRLASAYDVGDAASLKRANSIEEKATALRREKAILIARQHNLAIQRQAEAKAAEEQERNQRLVQAKQVADAVAEANVEADRAFVALREHLERRATALRALANTGMVDSAFVNKLAGKPSVTRACCFHQLHRHVAMENVAPQSHLPLTSINPVLLNIGRTPKPDPAPAEPEPAEVTTAEPEPPARPQLRPRTNGGGE